MEIVWADFVNSQWHDWRGTGKPPVNRLIQPEWQTAFLSKWNLNAPVPSDKENLDALTVFRDTLRGFIEHLAVDGEITDHIVLTLNQKMAQGGVTRQIHVDEDSYSIVLKPSKSDWTQVMAEIASDFAQSMITSGGTRIRICGNRDCRWVFYDDTRNRAKRFCEDKTCGNLMKVRRFRARKKEETD